MPKLFYLKFHFWQNFSGSFPYLNFRYWIKICSAFKRPFIILFLKSWNCEVLQGVCVRQRQYVFSTDSLGFSEIVCFCVAGMFTTQKVFVCHSQSVSITDNLYVPQKVSVCHRQFVYVSKSLSQVIFLNVPDWHLDRFIRDIWGC